ncbi:hypothetical protein [Streptomyces sp. NPDC050564]|uniref:hypothetical protein n=1 Tax=Streptomyces sp. NPDC050564 TaxID=3365631 RepID=UPI0037BBD5A8
MLLARTTGSLRPAFGQELYGGNDKAKRDLAGDMAVLANTAGGVLMLGVAEDDQARAAELPGVALSDGEVRLAAARGLSCGPGSWPLPPEQPVVMNSAVAAVA